MSKRNTSTTTGGMLYWVADRIVAPDFPDVHTALRDPDGLLAIGGDLEPVRLLDAYGRGIFPWYSHNQPVLWWSPDPRCILYPQNIHISGSLRKVMRKNYFQVTFNQAFDRIIRLCAEPRHSNPDTWITADIIDAYTELYRRGNILSVECWQDGSLVGGLYGVVIGKVYFGESMFSRIPDASKVALVHLAALLESRNFALIDCQIHSAHLASMGATLISRVQFVTLLHQHCHDCNPAQDWPVHSVLS